MTDARGLWLLPRKDAQNTGRADVAGRMRAAPVEIWSYGGSAGAYAYARPVRSGRHDAFFVQARSGLQLTRADGTTIWSRATLGVTAVIDLLDFGGARNAAALTTVGADGFALFDVATGQTLWSWATPRDTSIASYKLLQGADATRLYVFVKNAISAACFEFPADGAVRMLWQNEYPNAYLRNFGPLFALADMDNDGRPEIVVAGKPGYVGVIDADTGAMQFDLHYPIDGKHEIGRPYGLLQIGDMDGDGYNDVVVASCEVEEYIAVIHNDGGAGLTLAWSQFVEQDFPNDFRELRPNVTSLADVHGDGKRSLVLGLYNMDDDERWHTIIFDGMKGFNDRLADMPDRYFWGCYDIDDDGVPEIITSTETERRFAEATTVQLTDARTLEQIAEVQNATLSTATLRLPNDTAFFSMRFTPLYLTQPDGTHGIALRRDQGPEELWQMDGDRSLFSPIPMTSLSRVVLFSEGTGAIGRRDLAIEDEQSTPSAYDPIVSVVDGQRELIMARSDGTVIGGVPDLSRPGSFKRSWSGPGIAPSVWIGPDGARIVCTISPSGDRIYLQQPSMKGAGPVVAVTPPWPVYNYGMTRSARTVLPFGRDKLRLYVSMLRSKHALASMLYDEDGKELWRDELDAPYPRAAAIAELNGSGAETILTDNHGRHVFYDVDGSRRLIAEGWSHVVPGRSDGAKYSLPIVGPFGPDGGTRIVLSPGLDCLEILDAHGERVGKRPYAEHYEFDWCAAAVAQIRGDEAWDIGMVNVQGVFHCADLATGESRWTLDLGAKASYPINVAAGDVDGDGRDKFLVGMPSGDLIAIDEMDGEPFVLWRVAFPAGVKDAILADVDGDGFAEIIVETDDGAVRILKEP